MFGKGFSALGFLPAVLALALYSMLPVLRNTVTGLNGVDARLSEAARVVGVPPWRLLRDIELPLALPVIMAGIRTSAVWVIGTATLATPIGQTSLGNYIFTGLQTQNWVFVIFGCVAAALLALAVDQLLALVQAGVTRAQQCTDSRRHCRSRCVDARRPDPRLGAAASRLCHRRKDLHRAIHPRRADRAAPAGGGADRRAPAGLGSNVLFDALAKNEIDIAVDYSGTIWTNRMQRSDAPPRTSCSPNWRAGSTRNTTFACSARSDSRMPMRWR